jgi:C1A family cysteine protease
MAPVADRNFGWCPDLPDHRDYSLEHEAVVAMLRKFKVRTQKISALPSTVSWREYAGVVEDQGMRPTSAAHACAALIQHFERRATGRLLRLSRLFVHQTACRLAGCSIDSPVSLRATLKAIAQFGAPPEEHWPYDEEHFSRRPDAFAHGFQRQSRGLRYVRLDTRGTTGDETLARLKTLLALGSCFVLGFPIVRGLDGEPEIPFPTRADRVVGGHSVVAVGYDDKRRIRSDKGALLVRNSWGPQWGDGGFGWLPYAYVRERLAADLWTLVRPSWLKSGEFGVP